MSAADDGSDGASGGGTGEGAGVGEAPRRGRAAGWLDGDARRRRVAALTALPRSAPPAPVPDRVRPPKSSDGAHPLPRSASIGGLVAGSRVAGAVGGPVGRAVTVSIGVPAAVVPAIVDRAAADRQLVVGSVAVIVLARLVDGPAAWVVAAMLALGVLVGAGFSRVTASAGEVGSTVSVRARWESVVGGAAGVESGILPATLAFSVALAIRLVPFGWGLLVAAGVAYVLLDRTIALERTVAVSPDVAGERWKAMLATVATAFLGFAGVASMIDGGLAGVGAPALPESDLLALALGDAGLATLLGFRLARLGPAARREGVVSGLGFGAVVAIGAGLLRAMAIPQLVGPALLTLLVYLWDALNATTPSIRRDPRWRWQVGLLLVLSVVVIGWNLRLRP